MHPQLLSSQTCSHMAQCTAAGLAAQQMWVHSKTVCVGVHARCMRHKTAHVGVHAQCMSCHVCLGRQVVGRLTEELVTDRCLAKRWLLPNGCASQCIELKICGLHRVCQVSVMHAKWHNVCVTRSCESAHGLWVIKSQGLVNSQQTTAVYMEPKYESGHHGLGPLRESGRWKIGTW